MRGMFGKPQGVCAQVVISQFMLFVHYNGCCSTCTKSLEIPSSNSKVVRKSSLVENGEDPPTHTLLSNPPLHIVLIIGHGESRPFEEKS
jgi:hypothetical protein